MTLKSKTTAGYTVSEATFLTQIRLIKYREQAVEILEAMTEPSSETTSAVGTWALVAACTTPEMSWSEFSEMRDDLAMGVIETVMEINPHWFNSPDPNATGG